MECVAIMLPERLWIGSSLIEPIIVHGRELHTSDIERAS